MWNGEGAEKGDGLQDGKNILGERKAFVILSSRIVSEKGDTVKDAHACRIEHNKVLGTAGGSPCH